MLPEPVSSIPGYRRPTLVIQSNDFNRSRINTIIVAVITSNTKLAEAPGNVFLPQNVTGLPKDSVANVSQVITIDKSFLTERVGFLPAEFLQQVETGLRLVLSL
jgi:mRNA interferase MazF